MSWRIPFGLMAGRGGAGAAIVPFSNNIVVGVGDSITLANGTSGGTNPAVAGYAKFGMQTCNTATPPVGGYLAWAAIMPKTGDSSGDGRLRFGGVHGTGGATITQVKTNHIDGTDTPFGDDPKPGSCVICVGANDAASMGTQGAIDTRVALVLDMCTALAADGIRAVVLSACPHNTSPTNIKNFNATLGPAVTAAGHLFVDTHTSLANPDGTWLANHNAGGTDTVHPSVIGARVMAQVLRDALDEYLPATLPNLTTTATDDDADRLYKNGSFTDDGGTPDGVPDGGNPQVTGYWGKTANGCTWTLGTRAGYSGKACRWTKTTDPGDSSWLGGGGGAGSISVADGDRLGFGVRAEIASWDDATTWIFNGWNGANAGMKPFGLVLRRDALFSDPVAPFDWFYEMVIPTGWTAVGQWLRLNIQITGTGTSVLDGYCGQYTVLDMV